MGVDKLFHFIAGVAVSVVVNLFTGPLWGVAAALGAGVGKEVYDSKTGGDVDALDIVATVLGGITASVAMYYIN